MITLEQLKDLLNTNKYVNGWFDDNCVFHEGEVPQGELIYGTETYEDSTQAELIRTIKDNIWKIMGKEIDKREEILMMIEAEEKKRQDSTKKKQEEKQLDTHLTTIKSKEEQIKEEFHKL